MIWPFTSWELITIMSAAPWETQGRDPANQPAGQTDWSFNREQACFLSISWMAAAPSPFSLLFLCNTQKHVLWEPLTDVIYSTVLYANPIFLQETIVATPALHLHAQTHTHGALLLCLEKPVSRWRTTVEGVGFTWFRWDEVDNTVYLLQRQ